MPGKSLAMEEKPKGTLKMAQFLLNGRNVTSSVIRFIPLETRTVSLSSGLSCRGVFEDMHTL